MKTVIITGATSGMGLSAVKLFSHRGWRVVLADLNAEKGTQVVADLQQAGYANLFFQATDVSQADSVNALAVAIQAKGWTVDSLVNNAGIFVPGMLHQVKEADWDRIMAVDVKSIYLMSAAFVPGMIEQGHGTIVNTGSISGLRGDYNMAAYNAAKGAVVNLVRAMALDYGQYNIRVNNVDPSATKTPMFMANPPEVVAQFEQANPLKRIAQPEDIARVMYFLASDESDPINGENLPVSGGLEQHSGQPVQ
ncbi:SDR family NAD(P)-dependent oxidoreductase [Levilactobacillus tongjiangensis]|uniref:SDR family NAD(P)-dependent oxidoreductase n=1 Tax=Levilactobacillus tongjiangensis TaxID=2486023 RepID=A0ABW1SSW1_9LACO|nr:SDR family oxidoreductase [Levilactobacillus tongjiangensis]